MPVNRKVANADVIGVARLLCGDVVNPEKVVIFVVQIKLQSNV
jgi:hypothetical protein